MYCRLAFEYCGPDKYPAPPVLLVVTKVRSVRSTVLLLASAMNAVEPSADTPQPYQRPVTLPTDQSTPPLYEILEGPPYSHEMIVSALAEMYERNGATLKRRTQVAPMSFEVSMAPGVEVAPTNVEPSAESLRLNIAVGVESTEKLAPKSFEMTDRLPGSVEFCVPVITLPLGETVTSIHELPLGRPGAEANVTPALVDTSKPPGAVSLAIAIVRPSFEMPTLSNCPVTPGIVFHDVPLSIER